MDAGEGPIFFVGVATVVLRYAGFTILTDPSFLHAGDHVHLGYGLTSRKLASPAIEIEELPPLDLCILSHYHGDHFDRVAAAKLRGDLPILTTGHAARRLRKEGFEFSPAPGRTSLRLYITGDTLVFDELAEIPRRYPEIDIALFHLGGTRVFGVLLTMDGEQGARALRLIDPWEVVPIHRDDFDVFKSPLSDFQRAVERAGLSGRVRYLARGRRTASRSRPGGRRRRGSRSLDGSRREPVRWPTGVRVLPWPRVSRGEVTTPKGRRL